MFYGFTSLKVIMELGDVVVLSIVIEKVVIRAINFFYNNWENFKEISRLMEIICEFMWPESCRMDQFVH